MATAFIGERECSIQSASETAEEAPSPPSPEIAQPEGAAAVAGLHEIGLSSAGQWSSSGSGKVF